MEPVDKPETDENINEDSDNNNNNEPFDRDEAESEAKKLLEEGKQIFFEDRYAEAADLFSKSSQLLSKVFGVKSREAAEAYYYYGTSLYHVAQEMGMLGEGVQDAVNKTAEEMINEGEEGSVDGSEEENGNEEDYNNDKEGEEKENQEDESIRLPMHLEEHIPESVEQIEKGPLTKGSESDNDEVNEDGELESDPEDNDDENEDGELEGGPGDNDDRNENMELSWKILELARIILSENLDSASQSRLSDVHLTLGLIQAEEGHTDKAISDLEKCLEIRRNLYDSPKNRRISEAHYILATILSSLGERNEDAINHYKEAKYLLERHLTYANIEDDDLLKSELKRAISDVEEKINELVNLPQPSPNANFDSSVNMGVGNISNLPTTTDISTINFGVLGNALHPPNEKKPDHVFLKPAPVYDFGVVGNASSKEIINTNEEIKPIEHVPVIHLGIVGNASSKEIINTNENNEHSSEYKVQGNNKKRKAEEELEREKKRQKLEPEEKN